MNRDLRIYTFFVALPAVLLVALGIRLVVLEGGRSRAAAEAELNNRALQVATAIKAEFKKLSRESFQPPAREAPKPPPMRKKRWWRPKRQIECSQHEIPPPLRKAIDEVLARMDTQEIIEIRHSCGCVVVAGNEEITGEILGRSTLNPFLHGYTVCTAPAGGDREIALGVHMQVAFSLILFLLLCAALSAGVVLLVRAERRARDEARRKTDFLSNVSHELKTPLTSISLFSEMLSSGTLDPAASSKATATIFAESKRLTRLIDGLLEYAKLERGARSFAKVEFDLADVANEAAEAFRLSFPSPLELDLKPSIVVADRDATRRILDTLLENAAKYASCAPVKIVSGEGRITVIDDGPGMTPDEMKFAFDRFWRADNSVTRSTGGTGIGLAIAHELASGMGATLSLGANSPHGCIFALSFECHR